AGRSRRHAAGDPGRGQPQPAGSADVHALWICRVRPEGSFFAYLVLPPAGISRRLACGSPRLNWSSTGNPQAREKNFFGDLRRGAIRCGNPSGCGACREMSGFLFLFSVGGAGNHFLECPLSEFIPVPAGHSTTPGTLPLLPAKSTTFPRRGCALEGAFDH